MADAVTQKSPDRQSQIEEKREPKDRVPRVRFDTPDDDSGHNFFDKDAIVTDMKPGGVHHLDNLSTKDTEQDANIWAETDMKSTYNDTIYETGDHNHFDDTDESVVFHDPVKTSPTIDENPKRRTNDVFMTIARKKSVIINVDKWSAETVSITESLPGNVTYGIVDKRKSANMVSSGSIDNLKAGNNTRGKTGNQLNSSVDNLLEHEQVGGVVYAKVNKSWKTVEDNSRDSVSCCDDLDFCGKKQTSDDDDIGSCNDLDGDGGQKTMYAYINGKVMIVSDEGDYASVKSLSDSEESKPAEIIPSEAARHSVISFDSQMPAVPPPQLTATAKSERELYGQQSKYAVQYLGSVPITEDQLNPQNSSSAVAQCIVQVSQEKSPPSTSNIQYEWQKDVRMVLELNETNLKMKLLNSASGATYDDHFLHSIRIWAVGREPNSKHFAYIIRNKNQKHVCRVFLCDVAARHIASTVRNICHRLAGGREKKKPAPDTKQKLSSSAHNGVKGVSSVQSKEGSELASCSYVGKVVVEEASAKDVINSATQKVAKSIVEDKWKQVEVKLSPTTIDIVEKSSSRCISHPVNSVIDAGFSTKNSKLAAILIRDKDDVIRAHVFSCEPSAKGLVQEILAVCQTNSDASRKKQENTKGDSQKSKGGFRDLFSKKSGHKDSKA